MIDVYQLKKEKEYIIQNEDNGKIYKGVFISMLTSSIVAMTIEGKEIYFRIYNTFYDIEDIRFKANNPRQNMEHRALDKILKRIVNENFEW